MNARKLVAQTDGNAIEYRLDGVLLARCLVKPNPHPQDHMIAVVRRIREFCPDLGECGIENYRNARAIWDAKEVRL